MPIKESAFSGMMIKWLELFTRIGYNKISRRVDRKCFLQLMPLLTADLLF